DVAGGAAQDSAGNGNTAATQFSIENDGTSPTVALSTGSADPVSGAFTITATFSEAVTGFAIGDFSVGNGAASNFSATSATVYTATITPAADGTVTVDVAAAAAQDGAGNGNVAATQFTIENDETGPTVALSTGSADPVSGAFTITATFSEAVTGFAIGDFSVGNGAASNFSATSATVYTATITPAADGTVTVDVAAAAAQDSAGNGNTAATQFSIENDETAPTVALDGPAIDQVGTFTLSVDFSEGVTGLVLADFTVGNGSAANLAGSGSSYTLDITPTASGPVTVDLAANSAQDAAGNGNVAATQFAVDADLSLPELDSLVVSDVDIRIEDVGGSVTLTATFSEAMDASQTPVFTFSTDLSATLSLDNGAFSAGNTVYTATYSVADGGQVAADVDVTVSAAADAAGNALPDSPVADLLSVEMRRGSLSVAVAITGGTDGSFDFSGDLGDFSVATTSQAGATSFNDLAEGSYTFTAASTDGFNLDAISCTGGTFVLDAVAGSATVTLGPTDTVSCEFTQVAEPDVDETVIPVVTIELPTLADDPTSTTSSFDLQNVGGEAFYFTASTDQPWLAIDPTAGSIPATGSLEFTVSFTSAVLDLAPGAYTATITVVEVSPPAQRGGGSKANTLETLEIPVNIAIEPRLGDLTIITSTTAPEEGEGSFSYASTLTALDGQTVTTTGGSASTTVNDVLRGSYVLTQLASEGWDLASLSCTGDLDGGNVYDLASGQVTIDLDAEENMVCTFTNRRNEDYIRGVTLSAIRNFMATRADLILTNSPRLAGRMRSDRSSATPNSFAADFRDGRLNAQMSTSLSALRQAVEASQPQQPGDERFSLNGRTGMSSLDVWMQASVASVSDNRAGLGSDADFSIVHVGTDIMVSENVLAGVLIQYDQTDMTTGDWNSAVEGNGWMAGPYMVARISDHTYLDLRAAWGQSDNSVNPIGTYTDSFETDRWLIEANLAGDILHGGWRVTPGVGLAYFHESQDAYTDTLGIVIPGQTITIGRLSAGPEVAYRFENAAGGYVEPYLNVTALYDYDDADVFNAAGTLQTLGHLRGDARLGLTMEMANGGRISGEVSMIGLGEGDFEANSAMLRIRLPLSMH
ncbi:Ig-like domain-containing protein, partial [Maricaulis maris]|uniref:Ig-like domain-containing protein n=1 Tax=Maricaulis maris TaxID=74318 RepID=UPI003B8E1E6F